MEGLSFNDIYGEQEIDNLFGDVEESPSGDEGKKPKEKVSEEKNDETETTEVENSEELFGDEELKQPESVGSEKNKEEQEDAAAEKGSDTSPNFYSSIANALAVDGIFPNSDEEAISKVDSAETLSELIEAEINSRLDEKQQRIAKALENGVEPDAIKQYEGVLKRVNSITDVQLTAESPEGEKLRADLIYQNYLNKGYTPERAEKLTQRSIDNGNDIEDAKAALQDNREYFQGAYNKLLQEAQVNADKEKAERQKKAEKLKDDIMKDKQLFGDMEVDNTVRKKIYDNISKPVYKDSETGQYMTALQKYEMEHPTDFLKYVGLFMTLTNGFKDFESFTKGKIKKEVKKGLREFEQMVNNTRRTSDGKLDLVTNRKADPESFLSGNFKLAL